MAGVEKHEASHHEGLSAKDLVRQPLGRVGVSSPDGPACLANAIGESW